MGGGLKSARDPSVLGSSSELSSSNKSSTLVIGSSVQERARRGESRQKRQRKRRGRLSRESKERNRPDKDGRLVLIFINEVLDSLNGVVPLEDLIEGKRKDGSDRAFVQKKRGSWTDVVEMSNGIVGVSSC